MSSVKRRKTYLDGDGEINETAKYRTRKNIASVGETDDQIPNCSTRPDADQIQLEGIDFLHESGELDEISIPSHNFSRQNEINSPDEEFDRLPGHRNNPKNLQDLLQTPGFCDPVSATVGKSPAEILYMVLKYATSNKLSLTSTENLMRLINSMFTTPIMPESRYMIDKFFNFNDNTEFHATCPNCTTYIGKFGALNGTKKCSNCPTIVDVSKPSSGNYFVIVDPSEAISDYLHTHENHYNYIMRERCYERDHIRDVYDGQCYRNFVNNLPESERQQYVTAIFNTDGAPVFESSTYSIWPIYLMINELPVDERLKNLIVCGLWFGKSKPDMNIFLESFVKKINELSTIGIPCTIKGELLLVKLYALICCVDTIARAPMNGSMQFNAFYGCDWCLHPGEWLGGSMRYPILESISASRDKNRTIQLMKKAVVKGLPVFGIRDASPLINLCCYDLIDGCVPDYLHCLAFGVGKQLTEDLFKRLLSDDLKILESRQSRVKVPTQLGRLSRPLKERRTWKAREWENWILYYSIPVLESIVDERVLKHWSLLVESFHILLKSDITYQELDKADRMLHEFVCGVEEMYSKTAMTYNVHQLLHIAKSVSNWGPLWAHSTFPFESGNHQLLTAIKCAKGVNQQILRYINMKRSVDILETKIHANSSEIMEQYCTDTSNPRTKKCLQIADITYFGAASLIDKRLIDQFQLSTSTSTFMRIVKSGCLYASAGKENARSCNSFAQLVDERFVKIITFVVDIETDNQLLLCNVVQTTPSDFSKSLHRILVISDEVIAIRTMNIDRVCVFLDVTDTRYVSPVPNSYKY